MPLYAKILLGMGLGLGFGFLAMALHWEGFVHDWVAPWGDIFMRLLKLIAVPLVLVSLILGVVNLKDIRNLSRIGLKTILIYVCTTILAVSIGLGMVRSSNRERSSRKTDRRNSWNATSRPSRSARRRCSR